MSLHINVSNSLNNLAVKFASDLKASGSGVFQPYFIASQTVGMNNWLKLALSENMGILANCRFIKPNDIVNEIYYFLGGEDKIILSKDHLQWAIDNQLNKTEFKTRFKNVSEYYGDDTVKRMALAEKVADLFDQYQMYRYELIKKWDADTLGTDNTDELWQKWLWINAMQVLGDKFINRIMVHDFIFKKLKDKNTQQNLKEKFQRVSFFGLSIITKFHVKLFEALSDYVDISFYALNPSPDEAWMDKHTEERISKLMPSVPKNKKNAEGNALLADWGVVIKNTFHLFFESNNANLLYSAVKSEKPSPNSLLGKIQSDVFNNSGPAERNRITKKDLEDGSLIINSCYTPVREVEVLYNYLANIVDSAKVVDSVKEKISTRDILVIVSDIDKYAPYIKAIFDNAKYDFPYTIADQSFTASDNIFTALLQLLNINNENFKSETVLQLLDSKYIQSRFGIHDISLIRTAVDKANIRFGMDGREADDTKYLSFKNGLNRIVYGICLKDEEVFEMDGDEIFPLELAEGSEADQLIRFCHFAEVLMISIKEREQQKTLNEWVSYLSNMVENLVYDSEEEHESDFSDLLYHLGNLNSIGESRPERITFEVFKYVLSSMLSLETKANAFAKGGITFCSMIPMRSIPYKIVAVLGLDLDKFPRKDHPLGFDLMNKFKERGDRKVKENDKHLFLETLLSADEKLYLSYIGRSTKNNSVIPPSALIDGLLDYMESGSDVEKLREEFITLHPLHGFSKQYNLENKKLYSYLGDTEAPKPSGKGSSAKPDSLKEIKIEDLIRFFKSPFQYYYYKALGFYYGSEYEVLAETEKFAIDNYLDKWILKNKLLHLDQAEMEVFRKAEVKVGGLPLKNMSIVEVDKITNEISALKVVFNECREGADEGHASVDHKFDKYLLSGNLEGIYDDKLIVVSFSSKDYKDYKYSLQAYIKYLICVNCGLDLEVHLVSQSRNLAIKAKEISKPEASRQLIHLIGLFENAHIDIVPYFPEFKTEPGKIITFSDAELKAMIDKEEIYDEYFMREYDNGYFEDTATLKKFLNNYIGIHKSLITVFPDFA